MEKKSIDMTSVLHKGGTKDSERKNGETWINYWQRKMEEKLGYTLNIPDYCYSCKKTLAQIKKNNPKLKTVEMVGAHVYEWIMMCSSNPINYIVPTCNICNDTYPNSQESPHVFDVPSVYLIEAKESDDD